MCKMKYNFVQRPELGNKGNKGIREHSKIYWEGNFGWDTGLLRCCSLGTMENVTDLV